MSECPCFYSGASEEAMPLAYIERMRRARKIHRCCECGDPIAPGAQYQEVTGVWEAGPGRYRTCEGCAEIREALNCDGWIFGRLWDDLLEAGMIGATIPPSACILSAVGVAGARRLKDRWSEYVADEVGS